jgi:hypothetical protein
VSVREEYAILILPISTYHDLNWWRIKLYQRRRNNSIFIPIFISDS